MNNPIGWFEIYVDDINRAKNFYQGVFGMELERLSDPTGSDVEMWSFQCDFESYGATGALIQMAGSPAGGNSTVIYFSCRDCALEASRVAEFGGRVTQPKMSLGEHGFCSMVLDSEGNTIGLHSDI